MYLNLKHLFVYGLDKLAIKWNPASAIVMRRIENDAQCALSFIFRIDNKKRSATVIAENYQKS